VKKRVFRKRLVWDWVTTLGEIDQQYEKPEFPFHSQSGIWGEDFSVSSRIVLGNCIFWCRIRVLGAYSAPNPKNTKAFPPPRKALRSKPNTKTTDVTQPPHDHSLTPE